MAFRTMILIKHPAPGGAVLQMPRNCHVFFTRAPSRMCDMPRQYRTRAETPWLLVRALLQEVVPGSCSRDKNGSRFYRVPCCIRTV